MIQSIAILLLTLVALVTPPSTRAQSLWIPRDEEQGVLLEFLYTSLERYDEEFPTGTLYFSVRRQLGSTTAVVAEVPYIDVSAAYTGFGFAHSLEGEAQGNLYVGVEYRPTGSDFFVELGARAPTFGENNPDAALVGSYSDQGRFDAFAPSTVPIHVLGNIRHVTSAGLLTRIQFGPVLGIPTERQSARDPELYAAFAWQVGYEGRAVRVGGAITGNSLLTSPYPPLGNRTRSQFEFHADFGPWTLRPGVDLRLPIGSNANLVSLVIGGSVGASF